MKYKDLGNMLSKEEMKKVQGGKPPTFWLCMSGGYPGMCYISKIQCESQCNGWGEYCIVEYSNCMA